MLDRTNQCPLCRKWTLDNGGLCWSCLWTFDLGGPVALVTRRNIDKERGDVKQGDLSGQRRCDK